MWRHAAYVMSLIQILRGRSCNAIFGNLEFCRNQSRLPVSKIRYNRPRQAGLTENAVYAQL